MVAFDTLGFEPLGEGNKEHSSRAEAVDVTRVFSFCNICINNLLSCSSQIWTNEIFSIKKPRCLNLLSIDWICTLPLESKYPHHAEHTYVSSATAVALVTP